MRTSRAVCLLLAVATFGIAIAGCDEGANDPGGASPRNSQPLVGTTWSAFTINGVRTIGAPPPTITFTDTGVSGSAGCNHYGGTYHFDSTTDEIRFDRKLVATMVACVDERVMKQESAFVQAIAAATKASQTGDGRLILAGPDSEIVLVAEHEG
jgi:heat shock protein HslJ